MYDEYLGAIISTAQTATALPVAAGLLPPREGIAVSASGGAQTRFVGGDAMLKLSVSVNTKCAGQADALGALGAIHRALIAGQLTDAPAWRITGVSVRSAPMYMGQDASGLHIYTSAIEVRIYIRG